MKLLILVGALIGTSAFAQLPLPPSNFGLSTVAGDIAITLSTEVTRASEDHPLPFFSHWTTGSHIASSGFMPARQLELLTAGHYILPWFQMVEGEIVPTPSWIMNNAEYYREPLIQARALGLPFTLVGSQWERFLSGEPYLSLPPDQNPNVVTPAGTILPKVSPFGPVEHWRAVGLKLGSNVGLQQLQAWYPDPPAVIFLSNNEHAKLAWTEVETDARYVALYGLGRPDEFKRGVVAAGWIERYNALIGGMRDGLPESWREKAIFVGYGAFGPRHFGRWGGWMNYSLYVPGRLDISPYMWDGGSESYYTSDWSPEVDFKVWGPQVEFMNLVFMQGDDYRINPNFWLEMSVWDGYNGGQSNDKRAYYASIGQTYTPTRYAGWTQFGMWLLRPRIVREFRGWTHAWDNAAPYALALVGIVDRVHTSPALKEWWRNGKLIANRAHKHPYQNVIPPEFANEDRWFLLDANVNSQTYPWALTQEIAVYSLALTRGAAPNREWLIYAHSPVMDRMGVILTLPDYGTVQVDVPVGGAFYEVSENGGTVVQVPQ